MIYFSGDNLVLKLIDDKTKEYQMIIFDQKTVDGYKSCDNVSRSEVKEALSVAFDKILKQRSRR